MREQVNGFERILEFRPAFDRRHPDPSKNYGIHGVEMRWLLKGSEGTVQFLLYTNWHLPHVATEHREGPSVLFQPLPADLGYHSPVPMYESHKPINDGKPCSYLDGRPCYYAGSILMADEIFAVLVKKGEAALWSRLEQCYTDTLGTKARD